MGIIVFLFLWKCSLSITEISTTELQRIIFNGTNKIPLFVMFTSPNCPDCEGPLMSFTEASNELNDTVKFVVFDTTKDPNFTIKYQINVLPTFILFFKHNPVSYDGRQTISAFKFFALNVVELLLPKIDDSWIDSDEDRVILFTHRRIIPKMLVNLYGKYHRKDIDFGMTGNKTFAKHFPGVTFPSYWFFKGRGERMQYKGVNQQQQINAALESFFNISSKRIRKDRKPDHNEL